MSEPHTHLGASSRHAYCTDYQFLNGVPLKMFGRDENCETLTWLDVKNCTGTLYQDTFANLPKLEILNFTKCNFDKVSLAFKNLDCLRSIDIWRSKIPLNKATFEGCDKLSSLRVINCNEIDITEDSFVQLNNLEHLMIQNNKFRGCEVEFNTQDPFKGLKNLTYLGFDNCELKNININAFFQLDKLETLTINNIDFGDETFDFQSFKILPNLETISFPMMVLEKLDFSEFKKLKNVQFRLDDENAECLMNVLREKNINFEWYSSGAIPEFDERNPNIQICA